MGTRFDILNGTVDLLEGTVHGRGGPVALTANEVALLSALHDASPAACSPEHLLTEAFGYAASAKSRTVTVTIQRLRKKLEPEPAEPRTIVTVRGEGYALRYAEAPVVTPTAPATAPPGREADLDAVDAAFARGGCPVVLVGPGGMGKTTLARCWADREHATWIELFGVTDAGALRRRLMVGLDLEGHSKADEAVRARIATRTPIVLDNAEDLLPDARSALGSWISDGAMLLVTSQTPLGLAREQAVVLGDIDRDTARAVLLEVRQRSGLDPLDTPTIDALLDRFGGLPLALVIAAPVADFLEQALEALDMPSDATATHHRTLSEGVGRTFSRLDPETVEVATALAVFSGSATVHALAAVAGQSLPSLLKAVVTLRACGLVRREGRRVDLIPIARTLLRHRPEQEHTRKQSEDRFIGWLLSKHGTAHVKSVRQDLEHGVDLATGVDRLTLIALHFEMLYAFGPIDDLIPEATRLLSQFPPALAAEARAERGRALLMAGERIASRELLTESLVHVTEPETMARCGALLAMAFAWINNPDGIEWAHRALDATGPETRTHVRIQALTYAGYSLASLGQPQGLEIIEEAIQLASTDYPARALTAALSKARLSPASAPELDRCLLLLERVGDTLGEVQRAVDTADLAVILLDSHRIDEAWALLAAPRKVLESTHQIILSTILASASLRLLDHPALALELIGEVGPSVQPHWVTFITALAKRDHEALTPLSDELRALGEAYLAGKELPPGTGHYLIRAGLRTLLARPVTPSQATL